MPDLETPGARASVCAKPRKIALPNVRSRERPVGRLPVDRVEDEGADGEEDRDLPRLAEMALDRAAERGADDHGRDRGDDHDPRDPLVRVANRSRAHAAPPGADQADEIRPEVRDDCHERPEVQRDVERPVEVAFSSRYVQSKSQGTRIRWPDDEMGRSSVKP